MVKQKLENVGDVVVEQEAEDVNAFDARYANGDVTPQSDEPEEELSNVSASEQEKTLVREKRALLKDVGLIGAAYGAGKTSLISLAERVTEAAMSGSINPKDAEDIYNRFKEKADAKATLDDLTTPVPDAATADKPSQVDDVKSKKQQLSKFRSFIKLGNEYEDDGLDIVRRARNIHLRMLEGDRKAVMQGARTRSSLPSPHQVKDGKGVPMTDDEIEDFLGVDARKPRARWHGEAGSCARQRQGRAEGQQNARPSTASILTALSKRCAKRLPSSRTAKQAQGDR